MKIKTFIKKMILGERLLCAIEALASGPDFSFIYVDGHHQTIHDCKFDGTGMDVLKSFVPDEKTRSEILQKRMDAISDLISTFRSMQ